MIRPLRSTTSAAPPQTALNSDRAAMPDDPTILIITGVSGSGKTTIATALAQRLRWPFKEGADLHPASDISKMHVGHPLDDRAQWPLLERVADWIDGWRQAGQSGVITCSMLKRSYRDFLTSGRPEVRVVHLHGDRALIAARPPHAKNILRRQPFSTPSSQFWRGLIPTRIRSASTWAGQWRTLL